MLPSSRRHGHNFSHSKHSHWSSMHISKLNAVKVNGKQHSQELRWAGQSKSHSVTGLRGRSALLLQPKAVCV